MRPPGRPPTSSASGSEWIGGNTRGAAGRRVLPGHTRARVYRLARRARGAATALGDSAPVGKLGYYFGPGELGQQLLLLRRGIVASGVDSSLGSAPHDPAGPANTRRCQLPRRRPRMSGE